MPKVTVRLFGGLALPRQGRVIQVEVEAGAKLRDLVPHLEEDLGVSKLAETLAEHCLVAVDGTEIGRLGGWDTPLAEGTVVSIVPAMVGG